jgi:RHH-type transcriptional regulator, proline utilization regulon repressor / proline dehydrogenase / delta 1-pyrroline-5-carboxylate dehydrogenase
MKKSPYQGYEQVERSIQEYAPDLWQELRARTPGIFDRKYWQGRLIDWVIKDPEFKVDLFRFVDVLPALQSDALVAEYIKSYLLKQGRSVPKLLEISFRLLDNRLTAGVAAAILRKNITQMAANFIVGNTIEEAMPALAQFHKDGYAFTADILGEKTISDHESKNYLEHYFSLVDALSSEVAGWQVESSGDRGGESEVPLANISVKISALDSQIDPVDLHGSVARLKKCILPLLVHAREKNIFVNFDLEQWQYHFITYHLFGEIAASPELRDWPHIGIVVQAYLRQATKDVAFLESVALSRGVPFTVRLVKGAYWDYEVIHARQQGLEPPVWLHKAATDANYEKLSHTLLSKYENLRPAIASHNIRSLLCAEYQAEALQVPPEMMEIQMLVGMAEPVRELYRDRGRRVRLYSPIGRLLPGMSYLVRRLLENTSNSGFLRQGFYEEREVTELMQSPHELLSDEQAGAAKSTKTEADFRNSPLLDFVDPETVDRFSKAIEGVKAALPIEVTGGRRRAGGRKGALGWRETYSPNDSTLLVSRAFQVGTKEAWAAIGAAQRAWPAWRDLPLEERAAKLQRLGDLLSADRYRLAAMQCVEAGKPWREADGDVVEAIDFCRYYARQAIRELGCRPQGSMAGEENIVCLQGRGVTAVITPWNFPLAILCGMTTAALVAGNTVLIKPSRNASATALLFYQALKKAGFPLDVVQLLPGSGAVVGACLVEHPQVVQVAFTGSREVGLGIIAKTGSTKPGQHQVKRVVCEMGGKNANIVDSDADLDLAVAAVVKGAFGYAGQKCSACSRLIVVADIYSHFVSRLTAAIDSLCIAPADLPGCGMGPVIDREAKERLQSVVAQLGDGARILYRGENIPDNGYFVAPVLCEVESSSHPLFQEELFGPLLTIMQARDFEHALELAADSQYALTGAIFSRNKDHLAKVREAFRVGNLYINRASTGAMVGRQPFGGFAMSGLGNQAGGPGYLTLFCDQRCITENTMRQGFAPDLFL